MLPSAGPLWSSYAIRLCAILRLWYIYSLESTGGRGCEVLHKQAACWKMDSPVIRCPEDDDYKKTLVHLLAKVRHRSEVSGIVAVDMLVLAVGLSRRYFLLIRPFGSTSPTLGSVHKSITGYSRACKILSFWACEFPGAELLLCSSRAMKAVWDTSLVILQTSPVFSYYSELALRGSAEDQTAFG